jgi:glycosyltransferase involved in cell wall biosynthesis
VQLAIDSIEEHIIVDDHSSEAEFRQLINLTSKAKSCTIIRNDKNLGVVKASRVALARARSSHVILLGADDWVVSENIRLLKELTERYPHIGIVVGDLIIAKQRSNMETDFTERLIHVGPRSCRPIPVKQPSEFLGSAVLPRMHGQACVSTNALRGIGGYNASLRWNCDLYAHQQLALDHGMIYARIPFTAFRRRSNSFGNSCRSKRLRQIATIVSLLRSLKRPENLGMRKIYIESGQLFIHEGSLAAILRLKDYEYITIKYLSLKIAVSCFRRMYNIRSSLKSTISSPC